MKVSEYFILSDCQRLMNRVIDMLLMQRLQSNATSTDSKVDEVNEE